MEKNFSLISFLERLSNLEDKFNTFISYTKKCVDTTTDEICALKNMIINEIVMEIFPINDSMEMFSKTFKSGQKESEIIVLIFKIINKFYKKFNIKQISKEGVRFDPEIHEAIGLYPTDNNNLKGIVKTILQTGFIRNNLLLRPALVIVYN